MGLSFTEVQLLKSVYNGATAVLQIPAGLLAESMGEFWLLIGGNVWVSAGMIGMALSPVFAVLVPVTFVAGLGGGTQHPLASSMVSRAYDDRGRSTAVGTVNFAGDIGKMAAPVVAGLVAIFAGWRAAFAVVGVAGIVFMGLAATARRRLDVGRPDRSAPPPAEAVDSGEGTTQRGGFATLSVVGFLDSATRSGALAFLPFVMDDKGMGVGEISAMLFLLFAGGAAGKFVCGWLGERHSTVSIIWGTKGLTAALLVISLATPRFMLAPLMVVLGIGLNGTSSVLYATVAEFVPARRRARHYGVYYTTNEAGTLVAPLVYGLVADLVSLRASVVTMGVATLAILPASLALVRYLAPRSKASSP